MNTVRAITGGEDYGKKHLVNNDYYDVNHTIQGKWYGKGAAMLGLSGSVDGKDFAALMRAEHPQSGISLRLRGGGNKENADGEQIAKRCSAIDSTLSAPKGFSIIATRDSRCKQAWDSAVEKTIEQMESRMAIRDRTGDEVESRAAMPVIARYSHDASRALDPQAHDHLIFFNVAYDPVKKTWRALDTNQLYEHRALFTEILRSELGREMVALGYELHTNRDERGKYLGWEVQGVGAELREKFSERSRQKEAGIAAELSRRQELLKGFPGGNTHKLEAWLADKGELWADISGATLSGIEVNKIVRDTRAPKLRHISKEKVRELQESKMTSEEKRQLDKVVADAMARADSSILEHETTVSDNGRYVSAKEAIAWGLDHLIERKSVVDTGEVISTAMEHFRGLEIKSALEAFNTLRDEGKILLAAKRGTREWDMTTPEAIETETRILTLVKAGIGQHARIGQENFLPPVTGKESPSDKDQRRVIDKILASEDSVTLFVGAAGTGKTWCAGRIAEAIRAKGHKVWAIAPTASAVQELQKEGFESAKTIALTLITQMDKEGGAQPGDYIICDESGMVGNKAMLEILEYAHRRGGVRVILQGDSKQIQSVSSGDSMALIEAHTSTTRACLTEVRRQIPKRYKNAVKNLRTQPARGLDALVSMGAVEQCSPDELSDELARAWFAESDKSAAHGKKKSVLIVAGTHKVIDSVTKSIRDERIKRGEIDSTNEIRRVSLESTQWTEAEKGLAGEYTEQFIVRPQKDFKGFPRNTKAVVIGINKESGKIKLRNPDNGVIVEVSPKAIAKDCDVLRKKEIAVAVGDKIMFMVNRRMDKVNGSRRQCVNGEIGTVQSVNKETGDICLKDGRILGREFDDFCLAYAQTAFKSQGRTVDTVLVAGDGLNKELFYVAVSRGRRGVKIFTKNIVDLAHKISMSGARKTATAFAQHYYEEVMQKRSHDKQRESIAQAAAEKSVHAAISISHKPVAAPTIAEMKGRSGPGVSSQSKSVGGR